MTAHTRTRVTATDGVLTITLTAPPLHILDIAMMREIRSALASDDGRAAWCIVFDAEGDRAFSAGADIREHTADRVREMLTTFHGVFEDLAERDAISVAVVRGVALGGGCELAIACDLIVADEKATFAQPEIAVGCFPPVAALLLPGLVGPKRAADMVLTGRRMTAAEAHISGLVSRVARAGEVDTVRDELLASLRALSPEVLRLTKRALQVGMGGPDAFRARLRAVEDIYFRELAATADMSEGIAAFMEKRSPVWTGR
jgi:cyclohexa-1,5-dienecarbonyl-CoA hydratase